MSEADTIAKAWGLSEQEKHALLDHRDDLNAAVSIYDSLSLIFENDGRRADAWLRKPNKRYGGQSALDVMLDGRTEEVKKYLKYKSYFA